MNLHRPEGFIGRGRGKTGWSRPQNRLEQASKLIISLKSWHEEAWNQEGDASGPPNQLPTLHGFYTA